MMDDIIEAAFLSGFEPSSDDLSAEELAEEALRFEESSPTVVVA